MKTVKLNTSLSSILSKTTGLVLFFIILWSPFAKAQFGDFKIIAVCQVCEAQSVYAADLDGDGDKDVLSASRDDSKIAWYENQGNGSFGKQRVIDDQAREAKIVYASDLDGDGDIDVLSASGDEDKIVWYENQGNGIFGGENIINTGAGSAEALYTIDIDGDGDQDVFSDYFSFRGGIVWYDNNGDGTFGIGKTLEVGLSSVKSIFSADLDGDGNLDMLSASSGNEDQITWHRNQGNGDFGPPNIISSSVNGANSVSAADLDGDGDLDVISSAQDNNRIFWHENLGNGIFGDQEIISASVFRPQLVFVADLDGDGDKDVLSASRLDNKLAWYETRGDGTFGDQNIITNECE